MNINSIKNNRLVEYPSLFRAIEEDNPDSLRFEIDRLSGGQKDSYDYEFRCALIVNKALTHDPQKSIVYAPFAYANSLKNRNIAIILLQYGALPELEMKLNDYQRLHGIRTSKMARIAAKVILSESEIEQHQKIISLNSLLQAFLTCKNKNIKKVLKILEKLDHLLDLFDPELAHFLQEEVLINYSFAKIIKFLVTYKYSISEVKKEKLQKELIELFIKAHKGISYLNQLAKSNKQVETYETMIAHRILYPAQVYWDYSIAYVKLLKFTIFYFDLPINHVKDELGNNILLQIVKDGISVDYAESKLIDYLIFKKEVDPKAVNHKGENILTLETSNKVIDFSDLSVLLYVFDFDIDMPDYNGNSALYCQIIQLSQKVEQLWESKTHPYLKENFPSNIRNIDDFKIRYWFTHEIEPEFSNLGRLIEYDASTELHNIEGKNAWNLTDKTFIISYLKYLTDPKHDKEWTCEDRLNRRAIYIQLTSAQGTLVINLAKRIPGQTFTDITLTYQS